MSFSDKRIFSAICFLKLVGLTMMTFFIAAVASPCNAEDGFSHHVDPKGRFSLEYPSTMTVQAKSEDETIFSHGSASMRMSVDVIKRPKKASRDTKAFINAIKQNLKDEFKDVTIVSEGASASDPNQMYLVYSFTGRRGVKLTQLTQVYLADERILQLIISDRSEGFRNLDSAIQRIQNSLKILKPSLE